MLDIGAWDGLYSFNAEKMEAKSVTALDSYIWSRNRKTGFELAKKALNSKVKDVTMTVNDISSTVLGQFDVVLFAGVLYHLPDPFLGLRKVVDVVKLNGSLFLETHCDRSHNQYPYMKFHHKELLSGDTTIWWSPNEKCMDEMLDATGCKVDNKFYDAENPTRIIYYCTKIKDGRNINQ